MERKPHILIVEDYDAFRELFRKLLSSQDYSIEAVGTYIDAKRLLENNTFDVAIVDLRLSESDPSNVDGLKVLADIRKAENKPTSIIVVTGYGTPALAKKAFQEYKVLDFIEKDKLDSKELIEIVKQGILKSKTPEFKGDFQNVLTGDLRGAVINITSAVATKEEPVDIFISYARRDVILVQNIYDALLSKNHHPWMDIHSIKGGEDWLRAINHAIDECEIFLAILSNNSVSRRGVIQKELKKALDKWEGMLPSDIYLIPVRIDDCPIPDLVKHIQVLEWNNGKGENKLLEAIRVGLARRKNE